MAKRTFMPIMLSDDDRRRIAAGERLIRVRQVPWALFTDAHEDWSRRNHDQSLNRIAERGGFAASEMLAVLSCMPFEKMDDERAHRLLYTIVVAFNRGGLLATRGEHPVHRSPAAA